MKLRFFFAFLFIASLAGVGGAILAQEEPASEMQEETDGQATGESETSDATVAAVESENVEPVEPEGDEEDARNRAIEETHMPTRLSDDTNGGHQGEFGPQGPESEAPLDVEFPIPELGNCGSKEECRVYCDDPNTANACLVWARAHGIETQDERHEVPPEGGPGGCVSEKECAAYCDEPAHFGECVAYAEEHGRITAEKAQKLREKLSQRDEALKGKTGPGGCHSPQSCQQFCSDPQNMETCIAYAVQEGRMTTEQAARARRALQGNVEIPRTMRPHVRVPNVEIETSVEPDIDVEKVQRLLEEQDGPGGCSSFAECESYCNNPTNEDACFAYAVEHNLMPPEKLARIEKMRNAEGPGGCRGRACEQYCDQAGHEAECLEFAHEQGFLPTEQYSRMKKFVELEGPGGCRARQCEEYCNDSAHRTECIAFAKNNGLIPPEQAAAMERIDKKMQESGGPGGCGSEEECRRYCSDPSHFDECAAFAVDTGLLPPEQAQMMLKQFIEVEKFGPEGYHGDFGPSPAMGTFDPSRLNIEDIPPEYRAEFEERMKQFEQYRAQFEQGMMSGGFGEGDVPPPGFEEEFQKQYEQQYHEQFNQSQIPNSSGDGILNVRLEKDQFQSGFDLVISASGGMQSFSLSRVGGAPYGGRLSGCPGMYESSINPVHSDFPIKVTVVTCGGSTLTATIPSPFDGAPEQIAPQKYESFGGSTPPSGYESFGAPPAGYEDFQKQYEDQYRQQYEEQYKQQYEQQYQQQYSPEEYDSSYENTGASPFQVFLELFGL